MKKNKKESKKKGSGFYRAVYKIFRGIVGLVLNVRVVGAEKETEEPIAFVRRYRTSDGKFVTNPQPKPNCFSP